jgi:glycosyltransferase involved in cell wall biosynthesis
MPFSLNTVVKLAKAGWQVDVYLWEKPSGEYDFLLPLNVNIQYLPDSRLTRAVFLSNAWLEFTFKRDKNYACIFALGQIGAYIGHLLAQSNQCPFVYLNDEFPSHWSDSSWQRLEQQAVAQADIVVVPDAQRAYPLYQELGLPMTQPYAVLPNISIIDSLDVSIDWHDRLKLPPNSKPFLYAGTISTEMQIDQLIANVPQWIEPSVLIVNGRSERDINAFRKQYPDRLECDRVFWNNTPLAIGLLNSLVSYCEGNFALYQNTGSNIEYMGFSSGKLMRSLACGCPVIATRLPSLDFVEEHQLGVLISSPSEVSAAIEKLMENREEYRYRCLDFCMVYASFEKYWQIFCDQLKQITNIDLSI